MATRQIADRVKVTSLTTGTGTFTLSGATTGYRGFNTFTDGDTCYYVIEGVSGQWEVGLGTVGASGTTLARTSVITSSNAGAAVNFSAGVKSVFCDLPANVPTWDKGSQVYNVKAYGAMGNGSANDATAFTQAIAAASAAGGGIVELPPGTYALSSAVVLPNHVVLRGSRSGSVLLFTGATDGVQFGDGVVQGIGCGLKGVDIRTSHASGGKAITSPNTVGATVEAIIRDVRISHTGSGRWTHGLWADGMQVSRIDNLQVKQSATVGIRLQGEANANTFTGVEIVGSSGAGTITRGIELVNVLDPFFVGLVIQGYFTHSCLYSDDSSPRVSMAHFESTNAAPTDGAQIYVIGACRAASFTVTQGGSFLIGDGSADAIRNCEITGEGGTVVLASNCRQSSVKGRWSSVTDNGSQNTIGAAADADTDALIDSKVGGTFWAQGDLKIGSNGLTFRQNPAAPFQFELTAHTSITAGSVLGVSGPAVANVPVVVYGITTDSPTALVIATAAQTANLQEWQSSNNTVQVSIGPTGTLTLINGGNIAVGTGTGTKIGTAATQKLGFWNAAPVVQPTTAGAAATFVANAGTAVNDASTFDGYTLRQVVTALRTIGVLA